MPRENGGVGAISRASTDDSPNIRDDAAQCPEDGHVRPLARMQHQVSHLFAARQASHPGKLEPDLDQRVVPQARTCRERALERENVGNSLIVARLRRL